MAEFLADENFRLEVVEALRGLGHDVVTTVDAGLANQAVSDRAILEHAGGEGRAVLTLNRWDFVRLHHEHPEHAGIVVCARPIRTPPGRLRGSTRRCGARAPWEGR